MIQDLPYLLGHPPQKNPRESESLWGGGLYMVSKGVYDVQYVYILDKGVYDVYDAPSKWVDPHSPAPHKDYFDPKVGLLENRESPPQDQPPPPPMGFLFSSGPH